MVENMYYAVLDCSGCHDRKCSVTNGTKVCQSMVQQVLKLMTSINVINHEVLFVLCTR